MIGICACAPVTIAPAALIVSISACSFIQVHAFIAQNLLPLPPAYFSSAAPRILIASLYSAAPVTFAADALPTCVLLRSVYVGIFAPHQLGFGAEDSL